ncbi:MAG: outer membrane protein assembly factor BamD [Bacteroidales bacterium]|nr:outer membrane protein assembly factor BamD [Bacteroidales bacterium]
MKMRFLMFVLLGISLVSCSDYQKLLKSTDYELKWTKANEYYEQKNYSKAIYLLEELQSIHKGTDRAEQTLFMLANAYYNSKDYISASHYFEVYYKTYPKGIFTEDCRFLSGKAAYLDSPDPRLTQEETVKAMDQLNVFLDYYPESDKKEEVTNMLTELQEKLVYKQLLNCRLYYNLGNYLGNNYESCIITANNTLLDYPVSKYREELSFLILKSRYMLAVNSLDHLKVDRYRAAMDEYYSYINEYPKGGYVKEAENILKECKKIIKD